MRSNASSLPAERAAGYWWCVWPLFAGVLILVSFHAVGAKFFDGYALDLGSTKGPTPRYKNFLAVWGLFGTAAAVFLSVGFARLAARSIATTRLRHWWRSSSDGAWMLLGSLAGFVIPSVLRLFLLRGAPLTDDEGVYRFMAELLVSGRLRAPSPPLKLFFDRIFMINDGHLYGQYFIGWSALMVPGVWLGSTGVMNALYSAVTVPALFLVLRRLAGASWAKIGVLVFLSAPMLMVGAATELSHTSCLMALAWMTWFTLRSRDGDAPWWSHAGVALFFGFAFLIRPTSALGIGVPLLVWWVLALRSLRGRALAVCLTAFLLSAALMGSVFLAVNKVQNGSCTTASYQRYLSYMKENGYRFSGWEHLQAHELAIFRTDFSVPTVLANAGIALFRLNFDLFGWPCSFLFALLAGVRRFAAVLWASLLCFFCVHLYAFDSGIDSFGPVHYFETAWPVLLLTVLGLRVACETPQRQPADPTNTERGSPYVPPAFVPAALVAALVLVTLCGYVPVRFRALAQIADAINTPQEALKKAGLHRAVIFAPRPYVDLCRSWPNEHFVNWRPNNDPDLRNDILWVNHVSVEQDRRLMKYLLGRRAFVMQWVRGCRVEFLPLDDLAPGAVPDGYIGGTGEGVDEENGKQETGNEKLETGQWLEHRRHTHETCG